MFGFLDTTPWYFLEGDGGAGGGGEGEGDAGEGEGEGEGGPAPEGLLGDAQKRAAEKTGEGEGEGDKTPSKEPEGEKRKVAVDARPENLPDQFWDDKEKSVHIDALTKAFVDTKTAHDNLVSDKEIPASADFYFQNSMDAKGDIVLPESVSKVEPMNNEDPVFQGFIKSAHQHGLSTRQTHGIFNDFITLVDGILPEAFDSEAEYAKLGGEERGKVIADTNFAWIEAKRTQGVFNEDEFNALQVVGKSAAGISAIDKIRTQLVGQPRIPEGVNFQHEGAPTAEELYGMKMSDDYGTDMELTAKVDKWWPLVFTEEANIDLRGMGVKAAHDAGVQKRKTFKRNK